MKTKPPANQRKFSGAWEEIEYLYHKLLYWFYDRKDQQRALHFCDRLEELLQQADPEQDAIWTQECWSLISELKGDLAGAIQHRENEIRMIKRLRQISQHSPHKDFLLFRYGEGDLSDRLDLLAILYRDSGNLDKAIDVLKKSKRYCKSHSIPFDGKDLLRDYLAEKKQAVVENGIARRARQKRTPA